MIKITRKNLDSFVVEVSEIKSGNTKVRNSARDTSKQYNISLNTLSNMKLDQVYVIRNI